MKSKKKYKFFQLNRWSKSDGEMTYGKFKRRFSLKRTCRFLKHKKAETN